LFAVNLPLQCEILGRYAPQNDKCGCSTRGASVQDALRVLAGNQFRRLVGCFCRTPYACQAGHGTGPIWVGQVLRVSGASRLNAITGSAAFSRAIAVTFCRSVSLHLVPYQLTVAKTRGTVFMVHTGVRTHGDELPTMNLLSTVFGQALIDWRPADPDCVAVISVNL